MSSESSKYLKFGGATVLILMMLGYLAYTGVQESKSYYVTIKELRGLGDSAYTKRLRVAGNVQAGSIKRSGTHVDFILVEQDLSLPVSYAGTEPPPDTFKDNSQALADGSFGRDGVSYAKYAICNPPSAAGSWLSVREEPRTDGSATQKACSA